MTAHRLPNMSCFMLGRDFFLRVLFPRVGSFRPLRSLWTGFLRSYCSRLAYPLPRFKTDFVCRQCLWPLCWALFLSAIALLGWVSSLVLIQRLSSYSYVCDCYLVSQSHKIRPVDFHFCVDEPIHWSGNEMKEQRFLGIGRGFNTVDCIFKDCTW